MYFKPEIKMSELKQLLNQRTFKFHLLVSKLKENASYNLTQFLLGCQIFPYVYFYALFSLSSIKILNINSLFVRYKQKHSCCLSYIVSLTFDVWRSIPILAEFETSPSGVFLLWYRYEKIIDLFIVDFSKAHPDWELYLTLFIYTHFTFLSYPLLYLFKQLFTQV